VIQSLIMHGFLRISIDINSYKKCSPILSLSSMGQTYLDSHSPAERKEEYLKESKVEELESIEMRDNKQIENEFNYFDENYWQPPGYV